MPVVPIEAANSTAGHYYLLSYDKNGREVDDATQGKPSKDSPPNLMSQMLLSQPAKAATAGEPITDVFILSHGWLTTLPEAQASYDAWIAVVEQAKPTDIDPAKPLRPLIIAIHWPSKPHALSPTAPVSRVPLETHGQPAPPTSTRPKKHRAGPIAFLYSVVPFFSFYRMKARAEKIGANGVAPLIATLQAAQPGIRVHVMGHSFGAKVVAEALKHRQTSTVRPIASMFLVEGAFSTWAFAGKEANPYGTTDDGSVASVLALPMVTGVSVAGTSQWDYALHRMFPGAEAIDMTIKRIRHFPWRSPSLHQPPNASLVGAIGAWGFAGFAEKQQEHTMQAGAAGLAQTYGFQPGGICRVVTDAVVDLTQPTSGPPDRSLGNPFVGAHSNIAHAEVAHAWWEAVLASR